MKVLTDLKEPKKIIIILSVFVFLISLSQNAYYVTEKKESIGSFGLIVCLLGWMNLDGAGISWLANPFLIITWIMFFREKYKLAFITNLLSLFFMLSFLFFDSILINEAGSKGEIISYDYGYWLWLSSCSISLIGTFFSIKIRLNQNFEHKS